VASLRQHT